MTTFACVVCRIPRQVEDLVEVRSGVYWPGPEMSPRGLWCCRPGRSFVGPASCWQALGQRIADHDRRDAEMEAAVMAGADD